MAFKEAETPFRIGFYDIGKTIGKGNFSVVKLATHRLTMTEVAIKIIDKKKLSSENLMKILREVEIMKKLQHSHIVRLFQVIETDSMLYVIMEYVPNGEIFELISEHGKIKESEARKYFLQILAAVEYCHKNNIVHRDLKAENLLLDSNRNIKLADFGFSNFFQQGELLSTWCGSPPYAAPEIFNGEKYVGPKVDIWSLGVVLYVLVAGALPFDETTLPRLRDQVLNAYPRIPFWLSDDCEDLIKLMLCKNPERRISLSKVKSHRWLMGEMGPSTSSRNLPLLAEQMKVGDFNEVVIEYMERYGMNRAHIIESLKKCAYDNLTAIYLLLGDKLSQHRHSCPLTPDQGNVFRRPSAIAERVSLNHPLTQHLQQMQLNSMSDNNNKHRQSLGGGQMHNIPPQISATHHPHMFPNAVYVHNFGQQLSPPLLYQQQGPITDDRNHSICSSVGSDSLHRDSIDSTASSLRFDNSRRDIIRTSIDEGVEVDFTEYGSGIRRHTVTGGDSADPDVNASTVPQSVSNSYQLQTPSWEAWRHPHVYHHQQQGLGYPTVTYMTPSYIDCNLNRRASDGSMTNTDSQRLIRNLNPGNRANGFLHLPDQSNNGTSSSHHHSNHLQLAASHPLTESTSERQFLFPVTSMPTSCSLTPPLATTGFLMPHGAVPYSQQQQIMMQHHRMRRPAAPSSGVRNRGSCYRPPTSAMRLPYDQLRDLNLSVSHPIHEQSPEEVLPTCELEACDVTMDVTSDGIGH